MTIEFILKSGTKFSLPCPDRESGQAWIEAVRAYSHGTNPTLFSTESSENEAAFFLRVDEVAAVVWLPSEDITI